MVFLIVLYFEILMFLLDFMIVAILTELFTLLASNKDAIRAFEERMIPVFLQVLNLETCQQNPGLVSVILLF